MSSDHRRKHSDYMEWAKTRSRARYNLATSGVPNYPLAKLEVRLEDLDISGPSTYGYEPLQQRLARKCGVPQECIVAATGTSMANHLALAAILDAGDEVLIEQPTYEPLVAAAEYLGASIRRFPRRREEGFRIDPAEIERAISPRTRLVVLTNLHNPSGVLTPDTVLRQVGAIARSVGALVLVDEVYLEACFDLEVCSAFHLGENFLITSSLTKAYGLSGLRCGWILAPAELARSMWRLNDLFGVIPAHPAERLSVVALDQLSEIAAAAKALLDTNRAYVKSFLDSRADLTAVWPPAGTIVFPRLIGGRSDEFCSRLAEQYETSVVPGRFFDLPDHIRIGMGVLPETLVTGLGRIAAALDEAA